MTICTICGGVETTILSKEMNVSCGDYFEGRRLYPNNVGDKQLTECQNCGFTRFAFFWTWSDQQFQSNIYNQDYHLCDKPFLLDRPVKLAKWLAPLMGQRSVLDYGGGNGLMAKLLRDANVAAVSYDPYYDTTALPSSLFDIVTAFEVVEHVPDQATLFRTMSQFMKPDGFLLFSTLLRPEVIKPDWWYASPRNGHAAFHCERSLKALLNSLGLVTQSLSTEIHLAAFNTASFNLFTPDNIIAITDKPAFKFKTDWSTLEPNT